MITANGTSRWWPNWQSGAAAAAAQAAAGAEGELSAKMTAAVKEIVRREVDELRKELLEVIENR